MKLRNERIDRIKGILVLFVIIGHCDKTFPNGIIQIIYWFHMPCFFMISGYLFTKPRNLSVWIGKSIRRLLVPHIVWFSFISMITGNYSWERIVHFILGARNVGGVYWYIPCLCVSMFIFLLIQKFFGGGYFCLTILYLFSCIYIFLPLKSEAENITFSFGCMSLACTYIGIGYYVKKYELLKYRKNKIIMGFNISFLGGVAFLYKLGLYKYNMNMVGLQFGFPILNIIIPSGILLLLINSTYSLKGKASNFLAELGKGSLVIMYVHKLLLNDILEKIFGVEGFIWILNTILTTVLSYLVYKLISKNKILKTVFGG